MNERTHINLWGRNRGFVLVLWPLLEYVIGINVWAAPVIKSSTADLNRERTQHQEAQMSSEKKKKKDNP